VEDGVLVRLEKPANGQPKVVKVRVVADNIIQVSATPVEKFSEEASLMVLEDKARKTDWQYQEKGKTLVLNTKNLRVEVGADNGAVTFFDKSGKWCCRKITPESRPSCRQNYWGTPKATSCKKPSV
jgi:alpha-D-xyloside xylohydrolase